MKGYGLTVTALTIVMVGGSFGATEAVAPTEAVVSLESVAPGSADIIYVRANPAFTEEMIWSVDADGSRQRKISPGPVDVAPAYFPDGRRIAFSTLRDTPPGWHGERLFFSELYIMKADGSNAERVTNNQGLVDWQPTWSPNGSRILVARGPSIDPPPGQLTGPTDLWVINLATGQERQLTNSPDTWEGYADWSPDGSRIVFESDLLEPGNFDLYTIRVDGSGLRRLTTAPAWDGDPDYSPDGNRISFTIYADDGGADIYTIGVDGSGQRRLTTGQGANFHSVYSPDSRFIAFASDRDGAPSTLHSDIFVMRANGTQPTNLTRTRSVSEWDADWRPR